MAAPEPQFRRVRVGGRSKEKMRGCPQCVTAVFRGATGPGAGRQGLAGGRDWQGRGAGRAGGEAMLRLWRPL